jgi:hypothetical protein
MWRGFTERKYCDKLRQTGGLRSRPRRVRLVRFDDIRATWRPLLAALGSTLFVFQISTRPSDCRFCLIGGWTLGFHSGGQAGGDCIIGFAESFLAGGGGGGAPRPKG